MGSWHYNLGPRVSLNPTEEGGGCASHGEGRGVIAYLSGASFLLSLFCHPGPKPQCPTFRTGLTWSIL